MMHITITPMASTPADIWTTRKLLRWTGEYLERKAVDSPKLSAELLLAHVLGTSRIKLYADLDRPAAELERAAYRELVERAAKHEPVQYLIGEAHFFSNVFEVSPDVLIPRPSTEAVVEHIIQHARRTPGFTTPLVADVCTGSGAIAIALAKHLPNCRVVATDVDSARREILRASHGEHARITVIDPETWTEYSGACDLVVLDVPCSNTGVLARRLEARSRATDEVIGRLTSMQKQIIADALPLCAPGAHLLYTTCSVERAENDAIVDWLMTWHPFDVVERRTILPGGRAGDSAREYRDGGYHALLRRRAE